MAQFRVSLVLQESDGLSALFVLQGQQPGARFDLDALAADHARVSIGREKGNVIQIDDSEASRKHAEIRLHHGGFVLIDLNSSNGTFLNQQRIEESRLSPGDQIQVGRTLFLFARGDSAADAAASVQIVTPTGSVDGSRIISTIRDDAILPGDLPGHAQPRPDWADRARSNLQVMYRTALAISHTLDIDELLGRILHLVFEWIEADRGCIMLFDPSTHQLASKARRDRKAGDTSSMTISRTILDYVLDRREGVLTSDAQGDQRFSSGNSLLRTGVREALCVPMQGRYGTVGVMYVDTIVPLGEVMDAGGHRFNDEHLKLMIAIGHQAALAVEDTTYYSAMVQSERLAAVGQTIATLSHHIKNILQGIRGGSYLVEMGLENEDLAVLDKGWGIVRRNQDKISSLVMDMLSFSKEREPDPVPSDLAALITDIVETVHQRADDTGTSLRWSPPEAFPRLLFDPEGIHRAVLNVVTNALDAVEHRPAAEVVIDLAVDEEGEAARVTVSDNGPGIPPESLAEIFTLFVSTKGARGTGLGLTVSRKILREHGGDIEVTSRLGEGSRFTLLVPLQARVASGEGATTVAGGLTPAIPE